MSNTGGETDYDAVNGGTFPGLADEKISRSTQ